MTKTTTVTTCDRCDRPTTPAPKGHHRQARNPEGGVTFGVRVLVLNRAADLCPRCYNDIISWSMFTEFELGPKPIITAEEREVAVDILTRNRPQRVCPECKGKGLVSRPAPRPLHDDAIDHNCEHCEGTGDCPVPCSHDHL